MVTMLALLDHTGGRVLVLPDCRGGWLVVAVHVEQLQLRGIEAPRQRRAVCRMNSKPNRGLCSHRAISCDARIATACVGSRTRAVAVISTSPRIGVQPSSSPGPTVWSTRPEKRKSRATEPAITR